MQSPEHVPELFEIPAPAPVGRPKPILEDLFRAQLVLEKWERRRRLYAGLVIIFSAPLAFCLWRDMGVAVVLARFASLLWAFTLVGWGTAVTGSLVAGRAVDRLIALAGGRRLIVDRDGG